MLLAVALVPFVALAYLGVQAAVNTRQAFADLNASLDTLTRAVQLEGLVRQGMTDEVAAAREYLARRNEPAWQRFTRLTLTTDDAEAHYLGLPLTSDERLAVERMRTQHRLLEGVLQEAMARADGRPTPGLDAQLEAAQAASTRALGEVSRMLQERMTQMASTANDEAVHLARLVTALAGLFVVSLLLLVALVLRATEMQRRLVEAERLAAVAQVGVTLRHEINNPLAVVVGAADILREVKDDPREVGEWAEAVALAAARIRDVLRRLEELREVETVDYTPGVPMVDLKGTPPKRPAPDDPPGH
jgi:signal transduction histidine kinase